MSECALELLESLEVPVMRLEGSPWVVRFANRCAREWLGVSVDTPLAEAMPELDVARIQARLARGREAHHAQRTLVTPTFLAQYYFRPLPGGAMLVEGRSGAALQEAEAMVASYSLMVEKQKKQIEVEKTRVEKLLLNILPRKTVEELRQFGRTVPERFERVSVLFLDFVGFTELSQRLKPEELFRELNEIFTGFDEIVTRYGCERIKTIGDAYLAVCGMPDENPNHAEALVEAGLAMRAFIRRRNESSAYAWACRIGVQSGTVTAGVVGRLKYIYDIFGDGVNTASRMEAHADAMQINVSTATRELLGERFVVEPRGLVEVKGKGPMDMFYVHALRAGELHEVDGRVASGGLGVSTLFADSEPNR